MVLRVAGIWFGVCRGLVASYGGGFLCRRLDWGSAGLWGDVLSCSWTCGNGEYAKASWNIDVLSSGAFSSLMLCLDLRDCYIERGCVANSAQQPDF